MGLGLLLKNWKRKEKLKKQSLNRPILLCDELKIFIPKLKQNPRKILLGLFILAKFLSLNFYDNR
jgi:hypothetical protein